ncbi:MAG: ATP-binding cassette domain-containing protein [Prevotellaceae bacterium]|nr:ATP-binding cassette domain-containing protein [Prevotella sp.]MDD7258472.1 ATP-binding cassette domain-containing protein [Prevotellaceae bacterium]
MVEIQNISFKYAGSKQMVFNDFSLTLNENNIYGLLGKNGTGKSTLLYLISGLLRARSGKVMYNGVETNRREPDTLKEIFIVPEEFELPSTTLDAYVKINKPFYPRFSREVLESCLTDFELPLSLQLNSLSMGQKKKVFMSFALAAGTNLLLMDEPTNGLDIPSKSQFRKVVANNMSSDRTLIISTHQVHDVESLLDHILILDHDRLLMDSSVADICRDYTFEYRTPGVPADDIIYAEPSLQGNAVVARRQPGDDETQVNLELLFNAVTKGLVP